MFCPFSSIFISASPTPILGIPDFHCNLSRHHTNSSHVSCRVNTVMPPTCIFNVLSLFRSLFLYYSFECVFCILKLYTYHPMFNRFELSFISNLNIAFIILGASPLFICDKIQTADVFVCFCCALSSLPLFICFSICHRLLFRFPSNRNNNV